MIINRELVNRALLKAGQTLLTDADIENDSELWKTCKAFYLQTILETLTRTPWTSAKTRAKLVPVEEAENLSAYANMYRLPVDCARALKLNNGTDYVVEGDYLYTNDTNPILLYITNGRIEEPPAPDEPSIDGGSQDIDDTTGTGEEPNEEGIEQQAEEGTEEDTVPEEPSEEPEEDIPGYKTLEYDPNFWEYIETRIASKMVLKITGDTQLYNLLFSEASVIEQTAAKASKAAGKSKPAGQNYWTEEVVGR